MIDLFEIRFHLSVLFLSRLFMLQWLSKEIADAAEFRFKNVVYSRRKSYESKRSWMYQIAPYPKDNSFHRLDMFLLLIGNW